MRRHDVRGYGRYIRDQGYDWRLGPKLKHQRRLYIIGANNLERYVTISHTPSDVYAPNNVRRDIEKVMKELPPIQKEPKVSNDLAKELVKGVAAMNPNHPSLHQHPKPPEPKEPEVSNSFVQADDQVSYPVKIWLRGPSLAINIHVDILNKFPTHARNMRLVLLADKKLTMVFSSSGVSPVNTAGPDVKLFLFKRGSVAFQYTDRLDAPLGTIYARRKGDSLVTNEPLPSTLLGGPRPAPTRATRADEGKAAVKLFNEWLKIAFDAGMEPEVVFDGKHTVKVLVAEKRKVEI